MQNLPIPASAMPPQLNAAPVTLDTAPASGPDNEAFSAVLARELTAQKSETKPDTALSDAAIRDGQPQPPGSEMIPLQIPSETSLAAAALLALIPGMQPDPHAYGDQPQAPGSALPVVTSSTEPSAPRTFVPATFPAGSSGNSPLPRWEGHHGRADVTDRTHEPGERRVDGAEHNPSVPIAVDSGRNSLASIHSTVPEWERVMGSGPSALRPSASSDASHPRESPLNQMGSSGNFVGNKAGNEMISPLPRRERGPGEGGSSIYPPHPVPAPSLAALALPQLERVPSAPDISAREPVGAADFAASGKFLPLVAADEKTSRSGTEAQVTQRLPEAASLLQMSNLAATASPASAAAPTTQNLQLDTRVGTPGWNGELAQKVVWMVNQQQQVAELRLNPPHLGPVEVTLTVGNDPGA